MLLRGGRASSRPRFLAGGLRRGGLAPWSAWPSMASRAASPASAPLRALGRRARPCAGRPSHGGTSPSASGWAAAPRAGARARRTPGASCSSRGRGGSSAACRGSPSRPRTPAARPAAGRTGLGEPARVPRVAIRDLGLSLPPVSPISLALTTITWSPVSMWGAKIGLCLPRRIAATSDARRPSTAPLASMTYQRRSMSAASESRSSYVKGRPGAADDPCYLRFRPPSKPLGPAAGSERLTARDGGRRPRARASGPAAARSGRATRAVPGRADGHAPRSGSSRPSPTATSVPTRLRTICCRNAFARAVISTRSPRRATASRSRRRTVEAPRCGRRQNDAKSCSPTSVRAAARIARRTSSPGRCQTNRASNGSGQSPSSIRYGTRGRVAENRASKPSGAHRASVTTTSGPSVAFTGRCSRSRSRSPRPANDDDLRPRVDAGVGAPGDREPGDRPAHTR